MSPNTLAFGAAFVYVAFKAAQQLNVVHNRWLPIIPVSIGMTMCEFYLVAFMARSDPTAVAILAIGTGAGLGAMLSMYLFKERK